MIESKYLRSEIERRAVALLESLKPSGPEKHGSAGHMDTGAECALDEAIAAIAAGRLWEDLG